MGWLWRAVDLFEGVSGRDAARAGAAAQIRHHKVMSILMKIALGLGGVLLIIGSTLVTIAALFPPKEYNGNRQTPK